MTQRQYERLSAPFRTGWRRAALLAVNRLLTLGVYAWYIGMNLGLLWGRDRRLIATLAIPAVPFALLSLYRARLDAPRPYEVLSIQPLIAKDTRGKSFPSRHVFSTFVIAAVSLLVSPAAALLLIAVGVLLAAARVIGGVHFPRDVIAGALIGMLSGAVGLLIWRACGG